MTRSAPLNRFSVAPLAAMTRRLADVAAGRADPDLVIAGARVLSTYSERILRDREVWIAGGRIAAVRPAGSHRGGAARYDAGGGLIAPGLVDPHLHIESSMVTACAYAEAALLNGTTTIFCDSHEIGNVLDAQGVAWMLEDAREAPLNIYLTVPSTVPATSPDIETAGGDLTPEKIAALFDAWPEALALGEKMDFVAVAEGDARAHAIIATALERGRPVSGHIYGRDFVAPYAASGVTDTHEATDPDIADDLLEAGVWIFLRGGPPTTPWHSLPRAIGAVTEYGAAWKRVCACTDDRDADDLLAFGLDWVVREAVRNGIPKPAAWAMGSLHPATRFGLDGEIGGLGGGRRADLVLLDDDLTPRSTWYGGELVVEDRRATPVLEAALSRPYRYPAAAYATVHLPAPLPSLLPALPAAPCTVNAIRTTLPGIELVHERVSLQPGADWPGTLAAHDLCHVAVVERHGLGGRVGHGLLSAFGLTRGAVASSVGHDAHNLVVAGLNEADMRVAVEVLAREQGGVCVVEDGAVVAMVPLPVAGLLSDKRVGAVAAEMRTLKEAWARAGCAIPYMGFNLIPLSVIPRIRLTDMGLILVPEMRQIPLFEA
ncbi:adenine deaminase C-terminal domain-containing protein [Methylobacterium oxalidis]|uniref:Adenine deaminase n=1 Tax=Methylobacterium oxalidis TaxID=944322 RepID=A0A512J7P3_9HYPH|nr:adenine deaminase C-terminal domain-containing protein [Methylobacterium oxalidis]GEP05899.1 adenine deaminase 1 [Methylobacterium oxalidis]GJE32508.1 Adenine deaminase [Methylobacterium oxalidis]GLS61666.1 adenine deaminase 1 [Methylobacterium oxalidis]